MSDHAAEVAQAEAAFIDSLPTGDEPVNTPKEAPAAAQAAPAEEGKPEAQQAQSDPLVLPDSFTPQDVRGMLESITNPEAKAAAEAAVKNFQGDYTKSKQQLAEQAKAFEGLEDLEKAKAAVEFYDGIQNDPEFAMEVHGYLSRVFEEAGLTPGEAAAAASQEMKTPAQEAQAATPAPSFDDDPDAALKARQDQLEARLNSWEEQDNARQAQQREDELAADLLRQEMAIRQADPKLTEKQLDRIYDLAPAVGGNLLEAHKRWEEWRQDEISGYLETKQTSTHQQEPTPGAAVTPPEIPRLPDGSPDLDAVHKLAVQKLQNAMAGRD